MKRDIERLLKDYIDNNELAQASLIVRQNGRVVYEGLYGYRSLENKEPVRKDSIFRLMSMSKVVTAVCVLQLYERGLLNLDDPVEKYIPAFRNQRVAIRGQFVFTPNRPFKMLWQLKMFRMDKVKTEASERPITIRDLLSHSSGLEQGMVGLMAMMQNRKHKASSLKQQAEMYASYPLDFQPGTDTSYSPLAGFNILGYLISLISGMSFEEYVQKNICEPLEMKNTTFFLNEEQKTRLVDLYTGKKNKLINVTGSKKDLYDVMNMEKESFEAGCGGLYSTVEDYEHFAQMLLNEGFYKENVILKPETVRMMASEGAYRHLEKEAGLVWGLGVKVRQDPEACDSSASKGTYGWSGAFGTHFFVSPKDDLDVVFMTNRADLDGASSYVSKKIEEAVFENWRKE